MTERLPATLLAAIQDEARRATLLYGTPRARTDALQHLIMARLCVLTAAERDFLQVALPILARLRPGTWFHSREVLALAAALQDADGAALREACAPYRRDMTPASDDDARRLGKTMARCTGVPVAGFFLERLGAVRRSGSAGYRVVSCAGLMT